MQLMHNIDALQLCIFEDSELPLFRDTRRQLLQQLPRSVLLRAKLVEMRMWYDEWLATHKDRLSAPGVWRRVALATRDLL